MGELSAARVALEGAVVAPGTQATLVAVQDLERRFIGLGRVQQHHQERQARIRRRPIRETAEHLRLVLEFVPDTVVFHRAAQDVAGAEIPPDVFALLRMGRLAALQKLGGGVRGIVCGDLVRRLVARSILSRSRLQWRRRFLLFNTR